jgi:hypothetical protein
MTKQPLDHQVFYVPGFNCSICTTWRRRASSLFKTVRAADENNRLIETICYRESKDQTAVEQHNQENTAPELEISDEDGLRHFESRKIGSAFSLACNIRIQEIAGFA